MSPLTPQASVILLPQLRCSHLSSALHDYKRQTGTELTQTDHPLAKQLKNCNSVESITAAIQGQARDSAQETR